MGGSSLDISNLHFPFTEVWRIRLRGFQYSRSSSKWSKSFLWKWSWLKPRSAFLSNSSTVWNNIRPSVERYLSRHFFPVRLTRCWFLEDESSKAAWHRLEAALGEWICPRVFVAELLNGPEVLSLESKCIFAVVESWNHKNNNIVLNIMCILTCV